MRPLAGPPRLTPYLWNRRQTDAEPGAMVHSRGSRLFIPGAELRNVADALHDIADEQEADQ
ncbi:hypothetical protein Bfae_16900 [Brachybacterium faecium DSM 4810]|uniref:Uncharacterized protein n=1 Tax=Brachybacterium faecium (strain ATCC 43885 / DSM 4810 / JCM 11609 / LMG 19847 / NBRC 14762 / NCIMB 9860 / 6-10) TaxID=446465 RepID=C7MD54_BRAFD|nr:hypothetical protein Bfae_16900 [Brachybacterium faecium DSM 4810]